MPTAKQCCDVWILVRLVLWQAELVVLWTCISDGPLDVHGSGSGSAPDSYRVWVALVWWAGVVNDLWMLCCYDAAGCCHLRRHNPTQDHLRTWGLLLPMLLDFCLLLVACVLWFGHWLQHDDTSLLDQDVLATRVLLGVHVGGLLVPLGGLTFWAWSYQPPQQPPPAPLVEPPFVRIAE